MEKTSDEEKSGILSFHVAPSESSKIFFRGSGKQHWMTTDRGLKYVPLEPAFSIKEIKMHPTEPEWMLASHLTEGCKKTNRVDCSMEVYLSVDFGKTWKLLQCPVEATQQRTLRQFLFRTKPQSRKRARPRPEVSLLGWFPELYSRHINI